MMLGHIKEWFFSALAGIRPGAGSVAFKQIEIRPQPVGDVAWAKGRYESPYGMIRSDWKKSDSAFLLDVEIPVNTTATIYLPAKEGAAIKENGIALHDAIRFEKEHAIIFVGSGTYHFSVGE